MYIYNKIDGYTDKLVPIGVSCGSDLAESKIFFRCSAEVIPMASRSLSSMIFSPCQKKKHYMYDHVHVCENPQ